jgi:hypothetical protein
MRKDTTIALRTMPVMTLLCSIGFLHFPFTHAEQNNIFQFQDNDLSSEMPIHEEETIQRSFQFDATKGTKFLEVENINGTIEVQGSQSDRVQISVQRSVFAESKELMEDAKRDVKLDIAQEENAVRAVVNDPSPRACWCSYRSGGDGDGYFVKTDFRVEVPREINLRLKGVNAKRILVRNVSGSYSIYNGSGRIEMLGVAGSGTARTMCGDVKAVFRENPAANSFFGSMSGTIDLYFPRNLSADFRFRTSQGGFYSDFPVVELPKAGPVKEHDGEKTVVRFDAYAGVRVGSGGFEIKVSNPNGKVHIRQRDEKEEIEEND